MIKTILAIGVLNFILEYPVVAAIILGIIGYVAYAYYQEQKNEQLEENISLIDWKNPEIRRRIDWFLNPEIFGKFRIGGLTAGEILEARELSFKFLNYEAGKEKGELKEKLSSAEEQKLLLLMNKAYLFE